MNHKETIKQIAKMISSGDIPKIIYDKYLSKAPIGFMNCEELENFLLKENAKLKKHLKIPETFNLKTLEDYKSYYQDYTKEQILADTYIDYCAYVNLSHRYSELKKQLNELQKPQIFIDTQDMEERYGEELYQDYLEEQVKELKKQLEDTIEELELVRCDLHNRTSERDSAEKQLEEYKNQVNKGLYSTCLPYRTGYDKAVENYKNQQQEYIKFLEDNWKETQDIWYIKILQKYKEIIGVKDE